MSPIRKYLDHADVPASLRRIPHLLWIIHKANLILVPRNWHVRRMLRSLQQSGAVLGRIIDAGCGLGDHSFLAARMFPAASITGIDASSSNIDLCNRYAAAINSQQHMFLHSDLSDLPEVLPAPLVLCITVLQYIPDDIGALRKLRSLLTENGKMILYVPVRFKRYLSWYKRVSLSPHFSYDSRRGRAHTYTSEEITEKIRAAGFSLEQVEHTYGRSGAIAYELFSIGQYYLAHGSLIQRLTSAIGLILYVPLFLVVMGIDASQKHQSGNGVLLLLKKT